jgi:hypothetical protein
MRPAASSDLEGCIPIRDLKPGPIENSLMPAGQLFGGFQRPFNRQSVYSSHSPSF